MDVFAAGDGTPGTANGPDGMVFGPDGMLYVTTQGSVAVNGMPTYPGLPSEVLRYDIGTGVGEVFAEQPTPMADSGGYVSLLGVVFGPDCAGGSCDMFTSGFDSADMANPGVIMRWDGESATRAQALAKTAPP